jgi:hypothetical protein
MNGRIFESLVSGNRPCADFLVRRLGLSIWWRLYKAYRAVLGDDCGNKRDDCLMSYYWRIAERRGWDGPAPLGARQGLVGF